MAAFYQNAEICVAPSLFEGFGFTPLEAQAAGTAVVASNATSHPEVLGDSALLFDPMDVDDMADKMILVLLNNELKENLEQKGRVNVKQFDWRTTCENTFKLYR